MKPADLDLQSSRLFREPGPDGDVVFTTRVRLARNVDSFPFPNRLKGASRRELEAKLRHWIEDAEIADDLCYRNLAEAQPFERAVLRERHLISRESMEGPGDRGVSVAPRGLISIMTNEEDHLRIQVLRQGLALEPALKTALDIDRRLERRIPYAFHDRFGYLTACPSNVGTGLRISVMMHLPGLVLSRSLDKTIAAATSLGLTVRGFYGEGSQFVGDVIQISNQRTLGQSEHEIFESLSRFVPKVIQYERGVRSELHQRDRLSVEDRIWRAVGTVRYARRLESEETMELLSSVRLGLTLGILPATLPGLQLGELNELFISTQPAHLQLLRGKELDATDRAIARAALLRDRLKPASN